MKSKGIVVFKGIQERAGGKFKNSQGEEIDYDASYVVKFDEVSTSGEINERKVKFPKANKALYEDFARIEPYTKVVIECDVVIGQSIVKLVPIRVSEDLSDIEK